jgi:hypothetical protein
MLERLYKRFCHAVTFRMRTGVTMNPVNWRTRGIGYAAIMPMTVAPLTAMT